MSESGATTRNLRLMSTPAQAATPRADGDDQLSAELDAIITIGRALSHIPDAETRTRVMRWAIERFGIDVSPAGERGGDLDVPANMLPEPQPAHGDSLNLDGIGELFPPAGELSGSDPLERPRDRTRTAPEGPLRTALHWMGL